VRLISITTEAKNGTINVRAGTEASLVAEPPSPSPDVNAVGSDGIPVSDGVGSNGVGSLSPCVEGVGSDGVGSDGVGSDGGEDSDGVDLDGVDSDGVDSDWVGMDMDMLVDMWSERIRLQNIVSSGNRKSDVSRCNLRFLSASPTSTKRRSAPTMAMTLKKRYLIFVLKSSAHMKQSKYGER
jgi:hypothetical protein